ncbi:MAG TPA: leucyl/phenylalanyl-tRNA--protein transferase [Ruminococcus sp.]|nr:leucyl/phenylalanyl-tRNA--protein transferase [Ruminococcus sp.]
MAVYRLDDNDIYFPEPTLADDNGLLAVGGDLSVERLVLAYGNGIFPWFNENSPILWWCPKKRFIIRPSKIHVSSSMKKFFRKHEVYIRINRDFADTIHRCRTKRKTTWITDDMEEAYIRMYENNLAVSVESFIDGKLAGGLYGVCLGKCFFGESMFSDMENGSKAALIIFSKILEERNFLMIDCQFHTDHLESMGGEYISWEEYREMLDSLKKYDPQENL